jgi:hypothetical protein
MIALLLSCAPYPQEGPYEVVSSVGGDLDSCMSGGVWYTSGWSRIAVSILEPGLSFEFQVGNDDGSGTFPCSLDGDTFHCELVVDDGLDIDEVFVDGVWSTGSHAELVSTMVRTCDGAEERCREEAPSRNCGAASRRSIEPKE